MSEPHFLNGQLLIAMPGIGDPRFERSVILMCAHSEDGAMGIAINKLGDDIVFGDLVNRLEIFSPDDIEDIPKDVQNMRVLFGGPVETGRGFVLHTSDYLIPDNTLPIEDGFGLTATLDILRAMAAGDGPRETLLVLGYAGWAPGQLENEILNNGWLHCEPDEGILFTPDIGQKYEMALRKIGVDPRMLSSEAGHA